MLVTNTTAQNIAFGGDVSGKVKIVNKPPLPANQTVNIGVEQLISLPLFDRHFQNQVAAGNVRFAAGGALAADMQYLGAILFAFARQTDWRPIGAGNYAIVPRGLLINIIDISNPTSPVVVGTLPIIGTGAIVEVGSAYAYVLGIDTLRVVDVSVPANPVVVGSLTVGGAAFGEITRSGNTLFVTDWSSAVYLIDVTNKANPTLLSTLSDGGINFRPYYAMVCRGYLYVLDGFANMFVFDISDLTNPVQTYVEPLPSDGWTLALGANVLLVADGVFGMHIYDVSTPITPTYVSTYVPIGGARYVFIGQGLAYVFSLTGVLSVVDIADLSNPQLVGSSGAALIYPVQLVGCHFSALNILSGLNVIVDTSDPRSPVVLPSTIVLPSYPIAPYWTISR